jgi:phosphoribosylamine--glycine ligase
MKKEGRPFVGVIYFGLMLTSSGPKVIEYNARFGDPEAQAVLPRLENDLMDVVDACIDHTLDQISLRFRPGTSCCVVMASGGYPDHYDKGFEINGIEDSGRLVFHAGTKLSDGKILTSGGRVLCVYADGDTLDEAIDKAYEGVKMISFKGMHYRTDIGRTGRKD